MLRVAAPSAPAASQVPIRSAPLCLQVIPLPLTCCTLSRRNSTRERTNEIHQHDMYSTRARTTAASQVRVVSAISTVQARCLAPGSSFRSCPAHAPDSYMLQLCCIVGILPCAGGSLHCCLNFSGHETSDSACWQGMDVRPCQLGQQTMKAPISPRLKAEIQGAKR